MKTLFPETPKYGNKPTVVDGIRFDSKGEAMRWSELVMLEKAGVIADLRRQVPFTIPADFTHDGKAERGVRYIADFVYSQCGKLIAEDFKGAKTEVYKLKRKFLLAQNPSLVFVESHK